MQAQPHFPLAFCLSTLALWKEKREERLWSLQIATASVKEEIKKGVIQLVEER
jgi:hypothetical protein